MRGSSTVVEWDRDVCLCCTVLCCTVLDDRHDMSIDCLRRYSVIVELNQTDVMVWRVQDVSDTPPGTTER